MLLDVWAGVQEVQRSAKVCRSEAKGFAIAWRDDDSVTLLVALGVDCFPFLHKLVL
jgi:hypothetical protein